MSARSTGRDLESAYGSVAGSAPAPAASEKRLGTLVGDRVCTGCGYNLAGQLIVREPHYGLIIVRCPECGTVAGVQEYPLLGTWAQRWGMLVAAIWVVVLLAASVASSGALFGFAALTVDEGMRGYGRHLEELVSAEADAQAAAAGQPPSGQPLPGRPGLVLQNRIDFEDWWATQDPEALLASAGGWYGAIDWRATWTLLPGVPLLFLIGVFWSLALLHWRRWRLALVLVPIVSVAALFALILIGTDWSRPVTRAWQAAQVQLGPPFLATMLAAFVAPLALGLFLGRPFTRMWARALLAPRVRGALAGLWTADGLPPPRRRL